MFVQYKEALIKSLGSKADVAGRGADYKYGAKPDEVPPAPNAMPALPGMPAQPAPIEDLNAVPQQATPTATVEQPKPAPMPALPTIKPRPIAPAVQDQMARDAAKAKQALAKQGAASGGIGRGMASALRGVLNTQEQTRIDTLPGALSLHNTATDMYDAFQQANGNAGIAAKLLQQWSAGKPYLSPIAQKLQKNPAMIAELYKSVTRQGASEQAKLTNGSNALPTEEQIQHNQALYPGLAEPRETAIGKLNILNDTVLRPAMQGPIGRLELYRDKNGKYPVQLYQDVHDNLTKQLEGFGARIHTLGGAQQQGNGDMANSLLAPKVPPVGTIEDGHRFKGGNPADPNAWEIMK